MFRHLIYALGALLLSVLFAPVAQAQTATIYVNNSVAQAGGVFDSSGAYYVSNAANIYRVTSGGTVVNLYGAIPGGSSYVNGMTFNAAGDLIFSRELGNIYRFAAGCTAPCTATLYANVPGTPEEIGFDTAGNLYVANYNNGNVYRVAAGCVQPCASTIHATGASLSGSTFGLVLAANDDIYVLSDNGNVYRLAAGCVAPCTPTFLTDAGAIGRGLAFDGAGALYGAIPGDNQIKLIPTNGSAATTYSTGPGFNFPYALATGLDGSLYMADPGAQRAFRIAAAPFPPPVTVPTLSEWAMILFGLLLAGGAALTIQRRRLNA